MQSGASLCSQLNAEYQITNTVTPADDAVVLLCLNTRRARREAARQKEREVAQKLLADHNPVTTAATRHSWLIYTVPEKPVAGAWVGGVCLCVCVPGCNPPVTAAAAHVGLYAFCVPPSVHPLNHIYTHSTIHTPSLAASHTNNTTGCECILYYNRTQSEPLRERNRIQLQLGFNQWELAAEQVRCGCGRWFFGLNLRRSCLFGSWRQVLRVGSQPSPGDVWASLCLNDISCSVLCAVLHCMCLSCMCVSAVFTTFTL